jgi:O-antigen ligase
MAVVIPRRSPSLAYDAPPTQAGPDALLYALALMVWTYVWRVQDLFPVLGQLRINLIAAALAVGLFLIDRHPGRRVGWLKTPVLAFALALLGVAILGVPMSLWPVRSINALTTEFVPNLLLMAMLAASIRGARDLEWLALVNLIGACVYSLYVNLSFDIGADGRLTTVIFYDANDLALVLLCTIPFAVFFLVKAGWQYRLLGAASLILLVVTLVSSGSRGGFLGFVAILLFMLFGYRAIPRRVRFLVVIGGFGFFSLIASAAYWEQIRTLTNPTQDYNWSGQSPEGRMEVWRRGLGYVASHPALGVGLRNFPLAEGMLSEESRARTERGRGFKWSVAHNSFLEVAVELGLTGLIFFVGMIVAAFRAVAKSRSTPLLGDAESRSEVAFACTLSTALIGFVVAGMFVSAAYYSCLYVVLGLTAGFTKLHRWSRLQAFERRRWPSIGATSEPLPAPALVGGIRLRPPRRRGRALKPPDMVAR